MGLPGKEAAKKAAMHRAPAAPLRNYVSLTGRTNGLLHNAAKPSAQCAQDGGGDGRQVQDWLHSLITDICYLKNRYRLLHPVGIPLPINISSRDVHCTKTAGVFTISLAHCATPLEMNDIASQVTAIFEQYRPLQEDLA
jgi:hypothetical protein